MLEVRDQRHVQGLEQVMAGEAHEVGTGGHDDVVAGCSPRRGELRDELLVRPVGVDLQQHVEVIFELPQQVRGIVVAPAVEVELGFELAVRGRGLGHLRRRPAGGERSEAEHPETGQSRPAGDGRDLRFRCEHADREALTHRRTPPPRLRPTTARRPHPGRTGVPLRQGRGRGSRCSCRIGPCTGRHHRGKRRR